MTFGLLLAHVRTSAGLSQRELARRLEERGLTKVDHSKISRLESGASSYLSAAELSGIIEICGVQGDTARELLRLVEEAATGDTCPAAASDDEEAA